MIEPQNTMMPIAAATAPVEAPHSDVTFGEMLARTLGLNPQLAADAVQAIAGDESGAGQSADGAGVEGDYNRSLDRANAREDGIFTGVVPTRQFSITRPGGNGSVVTEPAIVGDAIEPSVPDPGDPVAGPVRGESDPTLPVVGPEGLPEADAVPVGTVSTATDPSQPPISEAAPTANQTELPVVPEGSDQAPTQRAPVDPAPIDAVPVDPAPVAQDRQQPLPVEAVPLDPVKSPVSDDGDTFEQMPAITRSRPTPPDGELDLEPASAGPVSTRNVVTRPAPPMTPRPDQSQTVAERTAVVATPGVVPIEEAAISLGVESPVQVTDGKIKLEPASSHGAERTIALSPESATHNTTTVSSFTSPAAPVMHTALAERVLQAVELQANQPPPRTMIIDIPELEGLRLVVSVRSGAEVHVVPTSSSPVTSGLQPFMRELEGVLADRGFVMTGDGRRRGGNEYRRDDEDLPRRARPSYESPDRQ